MSSRLKFERALVGPYTVPQECLLSDGELILEPNLLKLTDFLSLTIQQS